MQELDPRMMKGREIRADLGSIRRITSDSYKVKSQSSDTYYNVENTAIGWKCNCPDHRFRGAKCKHIWAVELSPRNKKASKAECSIRANSHYRLPLLPFAEHQESGDKTQ